MSGITGIGSPIVGNTVTAPIVGLNNITGSPGVMQQPHGVITGAIATNAAPSNIQGFVQTTANIPSTDNLIPKPVLDKQRIQSLVQEIDPLEQLDEDVEEVSYDLIS